MSAQNDSNAPKSKRLFGAGMLVTGVAFGAMFAPVGFAGAQEDDGAQSESTGAVRQGIRQQRSETLDALGIDSEALQAGREAGQSLAEVAAENGVSEADLVAAIEAAVELRLADAVESGRITQEQADEKSADLTESITERVNSPLSERSNRAPRVARFGGGEVLDELGLTFDDIRAGFEAGQTLAETAAANGVSESDLVDALVAQATARAEAAVDAERIDADDAAEILDGLEDRITERVNAEPGERSERTFRGHRGGQQDDVEETATVF